MENGQMEMVIKEPRGGWSDHPSSLQRSDCRKSDLSRKKEEAALRVTIAASQLRNAQDLLSYNNIAP
jgi:hypothetical protein